MLETLPLLLFAVMLMLPAASFVRSIVSHKVGKKLFHIECLPVLNTVSVFDIFVVSWLRFCFYSISDLFSCRSVS